MGAPVGIFPVLKRLLDVVFAAAGILVAAPVLLLAAIAIKLDSPGPVIFKQKRLGQGGQEFDFYKLRSMRLGAEQTGSGVYSDARDDRVSRIGRFLRATSLDELPQLVNILKGDMSFIGPRPPLTYHPWPIESYTDEQRKMFLVRPGISGWAQVNGRKGVEWNERIKLSVWYVENLSFALDARIVLMTVFKVVTNADNVNTGRTAQDQASSGQSDDGGGGSHSA